MVVDPTNLRSGCCRCGPPQWPAAGGTWTRKWRGSPAPPPAACLPGIVLSAKVLPLPPTPLPTASCPPKVPPRLHHSTEPPSTPPSPPARPSRRIGGRAPARRRGRCGRPYTPRGGHTVPPPNGQPTPPATPSYCQSGAKWTPIVRLPSAAAPAPGASSVGAAAAARATRRPALAPPHPRIANATGGSLLLSAGRLARPVAPRVSASPAAAAAILAIVPPSRQARAAGAGAEAPDSRG